MTAPLLITRDSPFKAAMMRIYERCVAPEDRPAALRVLARNTLFSAEEREVFAKLAELLTEQEAA